VLKKGTDVNLIAIEPLAQTRFDFDFGEPRWERCQHNSFGNIKHSTSHQDALGPGTLQ
jgi:hypothetical protein